MFETNSSSSHSVVIDEGTDFIPVEVDGDVIRISGGEYGWGYDELRDWYSRASYAYTYAKNYGRQKDIDLLKLVIEDYTKKKVVFEECEDDFYEDGYIDHQSVEEAETIFDGSDYRKLKQYLFGKGSHVIIDNDNH